MLSWWSASSNSVNVLHQLFGCWDYCSDYCSGCFYLISSFFKLSTIEFVKLMKFFLSMLYFGVVCCNNIIVMLIILFFVFLSDILKCFDCWDKLIVFFCCFWYFSWHVTLTDCCLTSSDVSLNESLICHVFCFFCCFYLKSSQVSSIDLM